MQVGMEQYRAGRLSEAERICQQVLQVDPNYPEALHLLGAIAHLVGKNESSVQLIQKAIHYAPSNPFFLNTLGEAYRGLRRLEDALACYDKALTIKADYAEALSNRGIALQELRRYEEALASYDKALTIMPGFAEALTNRGIALHELKRYDEALASYDRALTLKPELAYAFNNRGLALQELKRFEEALASYDRALTVRPTYAEALYNRGNVLQELKRHEEALVSYDGALTVKPEYVEALHNRGFALHGLKRYEEALASYQKALTIAPDSAELWNSRSLTLQELKRHDEALVSCDKALTLKPDFADALNNRGNALLDLKRYEEALADYDKALTIKPNLAEALHNRGAALDALKRYDEALASYDKALTTKPDLEFLYGARLHTKMQICDWDNVVGQVKELISKINRNEKASPPLTVLTLISSLPLQRKAAEIWVGGKFPPSLLLPPIPKRARHEKIRIGYFSADFRMHVLSALTAELFETHDRARFDVIAFSTGPESNDEMRKRLKSAFDKFIDVRHKADKDVAELARSLEIDIAIDLGGHTLDSRSGIFASRAAPIQVAYLGYLGTTGAPYIDYLLADKALIPEEYRHYYCEKIAYLPSYQANDSKRKISKKIFTRRELGLPDKGFVYCCFNNNFKITPDTFDGWMRILKSVEGSVLYLYADNDLAAANLKKQAALRGVDSQRLIFAKHIPQPEHLARYRAADLFLDTLPCNAGATASDALWAGVPVLTCMGEAFPSRVAGSLLRAIDLPELITTTQQQYEALAIKLAKNSKRLNALKQKLKRNRLKKPLFDTKLFTKHIEDAYALMYERYQADVPPAHVRVAS
jgi:protein O-GlcNAc transferase